MRLDGYDYYEMLLVYVDDIMIVSHLGDEASKKIGNFYNIKEGDKGPHTQYLGTDTEKIQTEDGREVWTNSSRYYINNTIETVEGFIIEGGKCEVFKSNDRNPLPSNYRP